MLTNWKKQYFFTALTTNVAIGLSPGNLLVAACLGVTISAVSKLSAKLLVDENISFFKHADSEMIASGVTVSFVKLFQTFFPISITITEANSVVMIATLGYMLIDFCSNPEEEILKGTKNKTDINVLL